MEVQVLKQLTDRRVASVDARIIRYPVTIIICCIRREGAPLCKQRVWIHYLEAQDRANTKDRQPNYANTFRKYVHTYTSI